MNSTCPREPEVLQAVECRSQRTTSEDLRRHIAACPVCSDIAAVAVAFEGARQSLVETAVLPDAGSVWRQSQLRARQEAVRSAGRPITAAQLVSFGAAMALFGAYVGATSTGVQSALAWIQRQSPTLDSLAWMTAVSGFVAERWLYFAVLACVVVLVPAAACWAISRD